MNNMQQFFKQAQKMQEKISEVQEEFEHKEVSGTSGAGLVNVSMNLKGVVKSIKVDRSIINPDDGEILEDLIVAAFNDAKVKCDKKVEEEMQGATGGLDMSKMGLGGLF